MTYIDCEEDFVHKDNVVYGKDNMLDDDTIFRVSNLYKVFSDEIQNYVSVILVKY